VIKLLVNLPSPHLGAPARPSTPEVLRARERAPTLSPSVVFTFGFAVNPSRSLGVRHSRIALLPIFSSVVGTLIV
jgi:hypothetical protein